MKTIKFTSLILFFMGSLILNSCKKEGSTLINNNGEETTIKQVYKTYSMEASLNNKQTISAELSTYLDVSNNTHMAYIEDIDGVRNIMYAKFDAKTKTFTKRILKKGVANENNSSPEIAVGASGDIHIVYLKKRNKSAGTKSGNYAIMYTNIFRGSITTNQVSTNGTNPTDNTHNIYNCYVNGRPKIYFQNGTVKIIYLAEGSNLNGYDKYFIRASKNGSSWNRKQLINAQDDASTNVDRGLSVAQNVSTLYGAQISTSNYTPFFLSQSTTWKKKDIPGYSGTFANKHIQLIEDKENDVHISWFNTIDNKFCYGKIKGSTISKIEEVPIGEDDHHGNFFPSTVDKETHEHIFFYQDYSGNGYLITSNGSLETKIDTKEIGEIYGHNALHINNEYISLTTASDSDGKIYITTNNYKK